MGGCVMAGRHKIGFLKHSTGATETYNTSVTSQSSAQQVANIFEIAAQQLTDVNSTTLNKFDAVIDARIKSKWDEQAFDVNLTNQ